MSLGACPASTATYNIAELENYTYAGGIAMGLASITMDPVTKRIPVSVLTAHVQTLQNANPSKVPKYPILFPGTSRINIDAQVGADSAFLNQVKTEYCAYEQRYNFALRQFLTRSTSTDAAQISSANGFLTACENLNKKINSILEILNLLNSSRVNNLNGEINVDIRNLNLDITNKSQQIEQQYALLSRNNAIVETQKQMLAYTKEKNEYVLNQIGLFTILNAFAIGSIFAIWRVLK